MADNFFYPGVRGRIARLLASGTDLTIPRYVRTATLRELIRNADGVSRKLRRRLLSIVDKRLDKNGLVCSMEMGQTFGPLTREPAIEGQMKIIYQLTVDLDKLPIVQIGDTPVA